MASSKIKGINIKIGADPTGLNDALKGIESAGRKASSELREIDRTIKTSGESTVLLEQKWKVLSEAVKSAKEKVNLLESAQEQVKKQFEDETISAEQYRAFQRELENARTNLSNLRSRLQETDDTLNTFRHSTDNASDDVQELGQNSNNTANNVEELGENAENAGKQAEKSGDGFTVMKGALADLVADGISRAIDGLKDFAKSAVETYTGFESGMSSVKAISGATGEKFELLTEKAKEMGETTKFTAEQASEAFGYMAMAGWDAEEMLDGIEGVMNLAAASGEDLGTTSDIVTDALTALGLTAQDTDHFVDVLAQTAANANTNVSLLGESFKYVAPLAGTMDASIEDLSLMLGTMANSGVKGSQGGNALKNALTNLFNPKESQISALKSLGLIETEWKVVVNEEEVQKAQKKLEEKQEKLRRKEYIYLNDRDNINKYWAYEDAFKEVQEAESAFAEAQVGTGQEIVGESVFYDKLGNVKSLKEIVDLLRESFKGIDFDGLGIDLAEIDLTDEEAYNDMLQKISQSEDGLTQAEQIQNAAIIFGKQNLSGMLALLNASEEDYNALADAIYNCDGAASDMSSTMIDNLEGDLTLFSSAVDGLKIAVGEQLSPVLRDVVQYATSKIPDLQKKVEKFTDKAVDAVEKIWNDLKIYAPKVVNIVKDVFKDVKSFVEAHKKVIEKIIDVVKPIAPVIEGIGGAVLTAWATIQSKNIATNAVKAINGIKDTIVGITTTGWGAVTVVGAVAGAIIGVGGLIYAHHKAKEAKMQQVYDDVTESARNLAEKVQSARDEMNDLKNSAREQVETDLADVYKTETLFTELNNLVDINGKVKQGYEDRVSYIVNELQDSTGVEIEMIDGQIQKYGELKTAISDVIQQKRAEVFQSGADEIYSKALMRNANIAGDIINAEEQKAQSQEKYETVKQRIKDSFLPENFDYWTETLGDFEYNIEKWYKKGLITDFNVSELQGAFDSLEMAKNSLNSLNAEVDENLRLIELYEQAETDFSTGQYQQAVANYSAMMNEQANFYANAKKSQEENLKDATESLQKEIKIWQKNHEYGLEQAEQSSYESIGKICSWLKSQSGSAAEKSKQQIIDILSQIDGFDTSKLLEFAEILGIDMGDRMAVSAVAQMQGNPAWFALQGGILGSLGVTDEHALFNIGLPMFAKGGFLRKGKAIVGEEGAELIELKNGGVEITPLENAFSSLPSTLYQLMNNVQYPENSDKTVRTAPVSEQPQIINNYYENTITANIADTYDVYRLDEDLSRLNRQRKAGVGL